ncbi:glutamate receptor 3.6-like isoform X1 [Quercus robur]|uniref:glutamate receptor 3.6-like isoform X1 n=1 Tax=Quercus robur TaxID=38942 RepID=UPI002162FD1E|nr:glutamate receptor 3.6-like isoform X1 [Quercus robur]XP_050257633.1 glutamate receptor 3.6-like isoform X1 [Quercus robur]
MTRVWLMVLVVFCHEIFSNGVVTNISTRPSVVDIGAILAYKSTIGKVAKVAIEAAIEDVNSDPTVLAGTKIQLTMQDSNYDGFLGIVETLQFMEKDKVAIIGPLNSVTAHVISQISNELQVPLLSYSATDPTLSSLQFPFFVRTSQSDLFQMAAVAEIVDYYGWKEVIALYVDDDYGRNGIVALGDKLAEKRCKISYKAPMPFEATRDDITDVLIKVSLTESRIIIVHTYDGQGSMVLNLAKYFGMMESGFVWIATNWLSTILDTYSPLASDVMDDFQGVITLRMYAPNSKLKRKFVSKWNNLTKGKSANASFGLNTYGLYAYDTVWLLAHAIDAFFNQGGVISFSNDSRLTELHGGSLRLDSLNIFNGGNLLLKSILQVNMSGVTGPIEFTPDKDFINPAFEIINVIGTGFIRVGYWTNYSGLSVLSPEVLYTKPPNRSSANQRLNSVIWPGQTTQLPRGWAFPKNGRKLRIGVPTRVSFREFVSQVEGTDIFKGYCIDVFTTALSLLPYAVPYKLVPFGDGRNNSSRTELVRLITTGAFDAAIGDISITTDRTRMVDFTQPYVESGLVVVASVKELNSNAWAFFRPFTPMMWLVTTISFLVVGAVVWFLERRNNEEFQGTPKKQFSTVLWFSFSTMFYAQMVKTERNPSRIVLLIWLFVVLIINASYTASLASILTLQQLSSPIKGIKTLINSNDPIGYQQGSYARSYLVEELGIHESRLVPLNSAEDYAKALKDGPQRGGVVAVVDDRAYVELFLSTRCEFSIEGQEFIKAGWGFAFPRDSPLAIDMSTAILKLSENGDLQRIHDKWLMRSACTAHGTTTQVYQLQLKSFQGLFALWGFTCLLALIVHFITLACKFPGVVGPRGQSSIYEHLQKFLMYVWENEKKDKDPSKRGDEGASTYKCVCNREII